MYAVSIVYGSVTGDIQTFQTRKEVDAFIEVHKKNRSGTFTGFPNERIIISEIVEDNNYSFNKTGQNYSIKY